MRKFKIDTKKAYLKAQNYQTSQMNGFKQRYNIPSCLGWFYLP